MMKGILTGLLYVKRDGIHLSRFAQRDLNQIHLTTSPTPGRNGHEQLQLERTQNECVQRGLKNDSSSIYQPNKYQDAEFMARMRHIQFRL